MKSTLFIEAQNTNWNGIPQFSYDNSTWFDDFTINSGLTDTKLFCEPY